MTPYTLTIQHNKYQLSTAIQTCLGILSLDMPYIEQRFVKLANSN